MSQKFKSYRSRERKHFFRKFNHKLKRRSSWTHLPAIQQDDGDGSIHFHQENNREYFKGSSL